MRGDECGSGSGYDVVKECVKAMGSKRLCMKREKKEAIKKKAKKIKEKKETMPLETMVLFWK